jgi:hypothetical protein
MIAAERKSRKERVISIKSKGWPGACIVGYTEVIFRRSEK